MSWDQWRAWAFVGLNGVMGVCGLVNVIAGTGFLVLVGQTKGLACLGAGVVLIFASTVERFELLKGLGMEAKTRQLTSTIAEAESVLASLRRLAELTGRAAMEASSAMGRMGGAQSLEQRYSLSRELKVVLEEVGSAKIAIRDALEPWARYAAIDVFLYLHRFAHEERHQKATMQGQSLNPYTAYAAFYNTAFPRMKRVDDCLSLLQEWLGIAEKFDEPVRSKMVAEMNVWLARLKYLVENLDLSDREEWFRVSKPPE